MPAGGQATVPVTYRPLTMTRVGDEARLAHSLAQHVTLMWAGAAGQAEEDASKSKKVTPENLSSH